MYFKVLYCIVKYNINVINVRFRIIFSDNNKQNNVNDARKIVNTERK